MTIKIYGYGWVGKAMKRLFPDARVHDPDLGMIANGASDVAFVCVPTPLKDGKLDTSIVEQVIRDSAEDLIIVRSTVMPGTCDKFREKNVCFMPEYLGESVDHPFINMEERKFLIIGGSAENRRKAIEVFYSVYNASIRIRQVTNYEAEVIKLAENRAIAFKVAQCQELWDCCQASSVDYNVIREAVYGDDPRFNLWWTFVYPENRGFSSKCIPKDVYGFAAWAESIGVEPTLTRIMLVLNEVYLSGRAQVV